MFWFGIGCVLGGVVVGLLLKGPLGIALTSLQILLFVAGLAIAGDLSGGAAALWALSGLFCHQSAYLAGVIFRVALEESVAKPSASVSAEIDRELSNMDSLAKKVASHAPDLEPEAADLSFLVSRLRRTLNSDRQLELLLAERRRVSR